MIDERILKQCKFQQSGGICYLTSYYYALWYYKRKLSPLCYFPPEPIWELFLNYIEENSDLSPAKDRITDYLCQAKSLFLMYDSRKSRNERFPFEDLLGIIFNTYFESLDKCGYQGLKMFDNYVITTAGKKYHDNHFFVLGEPIRDPDPNGKHIEEICHIIEKRETIAFVGYLSGSGMHSILKFERLDKTEYLFRDPNSSTVTPTITPDTDRFISPKLLPTTIGDRIMANLSGKDVREYMFASLAR